MAVVTVDAMSELQSIVSGKPPEVSAEIAADNASQAEVKAAKPNGKHPPNGAKPTAKAPEKPAEKVETPKEGEEDDSGLTAEQKTQYTASMLKQIARKHGQMKEAEEFAAEQYNIRRLAEQKLADAERRAAELEAKVNPPASKGMDEPKRANFETDEAYNNAVVDWKVDQRFAQREKEEAQRAEEAHQAKIVETAKGRIAEAIKLVPDFSEVVGSQDVAVPPHIASYMQESELFAELGYHFAQHPEVLESIAKMPARSYADVLRVGLAIGKVESTLQPFSTRTSATSAEKDTTTERRSGSAETPKTTASSTQTESAAGTSPSPTPRAAPVIRPVPTGSGVQVEKAPHERSYAEEKEHWARHNRVNLSMRKRH